MKKHIFYPKVNKRGTPIAVSFLIASRSSERNQELILPEKPENQFTSLKQQLDIEDLAKYRKRKGDGDPYTQAVTFLISSSTRTQAIH